LNKLESLVYNQIKTKPFLKDRVRDIYQRLWDVLPVKRTVSAYDIETREGFFFGFHDKCPWSGDGTMLLAHRFNIPLRMPKADDMVEVGYFRGPEYMSFTSIGTTYAWNWHQGAMLQWVGESLNIVFNDFDGQKHVARIVDYEGNAVTTLPLPVAAVSLDGHLALSYSFARLRGTPFGYAYANGKDKEADRLIPSKDGLYLINIASGKINLLFTIADIVAYQPTASMQGAFHYFSHCQFSPSGKRFKFFHRWAKPNGSNGTRMISSDLEGKNIFIFPTARMVSHVAWHDDEHIVAYARTNEFGDKYYRFQDRGDNFSIIGEDAFHSDGHPSFSKDGRWMLTDTYPDRFRRRYLILYDMKRQKRYNLATLYSPKQYVGDLAVGAIRCDLHPRWSRDNTMICFDSAHSGKRALCTIALGNLVSDGGEPPIVN
jgi:hypothetical protein